MADMKIGIVSDGRPKIGMGGMPREVAREIVNAIRSVHNNLLDVEEEAIITLITPKKVVWKEEGYDERADYYPYCPNCDADFSPISMNEEKHFCPYCGQPLDWSE